MNTSDQDFPDSPESDATGRSRLKSNLIVSWAAQFLVLVAGFVVPRQISDSIGQEALGIWDFCWSIVRYLSISNFGFVGAIGRYTSLYRAGGDFEKLRVMISTSIVWQVVLGLVVVVLALGASQILPELMSNLPHSMLGATAWVIFLLGAGLGIEMGADVSRGVLTGFHRWGINSTVNAGIDVATACGLVSVLYFDGGLIDIAWVAFVSSAIGAAVRLAFANRFFAFSRISIRLWDLRLAKNLFVFGFKQSVLNVPAMVVIQSMAMLIAFASGPAALAIFTRPLALATNIDTLSRKYSSMLSNVAGSLSGLGKREEARQLFIESSNFTGTFAFPMLAILAVYGDLIISIWMGPEYVLSALAIVFAIGFALPQLGNTASSIMIGLNAHGSVAKASLIAAISLTAAAVYVLFLFGVTLEKSAIALAVLLAVTRGIVPIICACKHLDISFLEYMTEAVVRPLSVVAVFVAAMLLARLLVTGHILMQIMTGVSFGAVCVAAYYWYVLLTPEMKARVGNIIAKNPTKPSEKH